MKQVFDLAGLQSELNDNPVVVTYYSSESCNVCKTLKPKVIEMMQMQFPKAALLYIDTEKSPVVAGQHRVFSIPTIDVYVDGKEHARFSRNVAFFEFEAAVRKPYDILLGE